MSDLVLTNPHSIVAALQTRPEAVFEVRLGRQRSTLWSEIVEVARRGGVGVREMVATDRSPRGRHGSRREGGGEATVRERPAVSLEEVLSGTDSPGLWLALDQIQDPQNLGAIFRSAAFFGVRGIIATKDHSAPLSAAAYDVASGGVEHVPFAQPANLARALQLAKDRGLWVLGASEHARTDLSDVDKDRNWLLVIGNEERGLRQLTLKSCDEVCCIAGSGPVPSLNASAAAAVLIAGLIRA